MTSIKKIKIISSAITFNSKIIFMTYSVLNNFKMNSQMLNKKKKKKPWPFMSEKNE